MGPRSPDSPASVAGPVASAASASASAVDMSSRYANHPDPEGAARRDAALNARVNAAAASASAILSQAFTSISATPTALMPLHSAAGLLGSGPSTLRGGGSVHGGMPFTTPSLLAPSAPGSFVHNADVSRGGAPLLGLDGRPANISRNSAHAVPTPYSTTVPFALPLSLSEHSAAARAEASITDASTGPSMYLRPLTSTVSVPDSVGPYMSQFAASVRPAAPVHNPGISATGSVVLNSSVNDFMTRLESIKSSIFNRMGIKGEGVGTPRDAMGMPLVGGGGSGGIGGMGSAMPAGSADGISPGSALLPSSLVTPTGE